MSRLKVYHNGDWEYADSTSAGGGTAQPDFVLSGTTSNNTPSSSEIASALSNITFNSTIAEMLAKVRANGSLDIGGCFASEGSGRTSYIKSIIDLKTAPIAIFPKASAIAAGFTTADDDVLLLYLGTDSAVGSYGVATNATYVYIASLGGTLTCATVPT